MQSIVFHWEPDGNDIYLPLGFVPDWVRLCEIGTTNPSFYEWWEMQEDDEASGSQEGVIIKGGSTTFTKCADSEGIIAYDSGSQGPTVTTWSESAANAATAKTATAHGTYIKPTTSSTMSREAIFECVTAGTSSATEPTWPAGIGEQVLDGTVLFERVNVALTRIGYQGIVVAGELQTDGQEFYGIALQVENAIDFGDVVGWTGGVQGA